jgi:hypothetical protein
VQKEVRDLSRVLAHVLSHLRNGVALIRQRRRDCRMARFVWTFAAGDKRDQGNSTGFGPN